MNSPPDIHPGREVLQAFAEATLDDAMAATVVDHLDNCASCRILLTALPDDSLLERLRAARRLEETGEVVNALSRVPVAPANLSQSKNTPILGPETMGPGLGGTSFPTDVPPELLQLKDYKIERELGRGGMGVVYLVFNRDMRRHEVLKVMNKTLADQPEIRERFFRELRAAARLNHTNVATAYASVSVGDSVAFTMEYVQGDDLEKITEKAGGSLPVANACYYLHQAASGLQHAFEKGLVHRDIKPNNLILAREGKKHVVKVVDFGLAKVRSEQSVGNLTGEQVFGTPAYMAPEQWRSTAGADIRADIYSLGCTLYFLLTGEPPFSGPGMPQYLYAHEFKQPPPLDELRRDVPPALAEIARKMLSKDPAQRYQKPSEVARALLPFFKQGSRPPDAPPIRQPRAGPPTRIPTAKLTLSPVTPAPAEAELWKDIGKVVDTPQLNETKTESLKTWRVPAGIAAGLLFLSLVVMWAGGVFKVKTANGTIVLENLPTDAEVTVDGDKVSITWDRNGKRAEISVKPGKHTIVAVADGITVVGEEVEIASADRKDISVRIEPLPRDLTPQATIDRAIKAFGADLLKSQANWEKGKGKSYTHGNSFTSEVSSLQPDKFKEVVDLEENGRRVRIITVYDGKNGWTSINGQPLLVDDKRRSDLRELMNVIRIQRLLPLKNMDEFTLSPLGESQVNGRPAVGVKVAAKGFREVNIYFDKETALTAKIERTAWDLRARQFVGEERIILEYQVLEGRKVAKKVEVNRNGNKHFEVEVVEFRPNARFEANDFTLAGVSVEPAAAKTGLVDAAAQVAAVAAKLKELNPGFDGQLSPVIKAGEVTDLSFSSANVQDISPLRALTRLQVLQLRADPAEGILSDLSPLQGMKLTVLNLGNCRQVRDLTPLKDMSLTWLSLFGCGQVRDLTPLQGMPLTHLDLASCSLQMNDLTPLKGMRLTFLGLRGFGRVSDFTVLEGMPLYELSLQGVRELGDLTSLQRMPLRRLWLFNSGAKDLTTLEGMQLEVISLSPDRITRGMDVLRKMTSLRTIRVDPTSYPAADFWKKYDAGEFGKGGGNESPARKAEEKTAPETVPFSGERDQSPIRVLQGHAGRVWRVAFSPDGKHLLSGSNSHFGVPDPVQKVTNNFPGDDNTVRLWEVATGRQAILLRGHKWEVMGLAFSPRDSRVAAACSSTEWATDYANPTAVVYNLKTGELTHKFSLPPRPGMRGIALAADGKRLLVCRGNRTLEAWDLATNTKRPTVTLETEGGENALWSVAFTADRRRVLGGLGGGPVRLWDAKSGTAIQHYLGHTRRVQSVAFSPDEKRIASASEDGTVRVWDVEDAKEVLCLNGHEKGIGAPSENERAVRGVTFSPDGRWILSGGWDGTVRLWDAKTGIELRRYLGHTECVRAVDISPNGNLAASASDDKTVRLWRLPAPRSSPTPVANGPRQSASATLKPEVEDPIKSPKPESPLRVGDDEPTTSVSPGLSELVREAKNAPPEIRDLYQQMWPPHDRVFWRDGRSMKIEPFPARIADERAEYSGKAEMQTLADGERGSVRMEFRRKEITHIEPFELFALERVRSFVQALRDHKTLSIARLRAAERVLIAVEAFHLSARETGLREGPGWVDISNQLPKRLREVQGLETAVPINEVSNSLGMRLAWIPAGRIHLGSPNDETERRNGEPSRHAAEITKAFYLGKYEVTRGQFRRFIDDTGYRTDAEKEGMASKYDSNKRMFFFDFKGASWKDPGFQQTDEHPVLNVSWNDALAFCIWLGRKDGGIYRLPTEAEWEYSCRAFTTTRFYGGGSENELRAIANVADQSLNEKLDLSQLADPTERKSATDWLAKVAWDDGYPFTAPVGRFQPNQFGLHDMHGNVWEWCEDSVGSSRVFRGGSFSRGSQDCRAASRGLRKPDYRATDLGFRVVREQ